ncbi:hypothetical protein F6P93_05750 [Escherichia coli]|nr:hypothetical protein F6P93_05750 [Escherichia coli]
MPAIIRRQKLSGLQARCGFVIHQFAGLLLPSSRAMAMPSMRRVTDRTCRQRAGIDSPPTNSPLLEYRAVPRKSNAEITVGAKRRYRADFQRRSREKKKKRHDAENAYPCCGINDEMESLVNGTGTKHT